MSQDIPKIYAFDLDGTLTESKERMDGEMAGLLVEMLAFARVAIISGAAFKQFETQVLTAVDQALANDPKRGKPLKDLFVIPENGSAFYAYTEGSWQPLYHEVFSPAEKDKIISVLTDVTKEISAKLDLGGGHGEQIEDRGGQITFSALGQKAPIDLKAAWDPDVSIRKRLVQELRSRLPGYEVSAGGMTSIDITRKGITKAYAIKKIEEVLKVRPSDIAYIGDALFPGGNDYAAVSSGAETVKVDSVSDTKAFIRRQIVMQNEILKPRRR